MRAPSRPATLALGVSLAARGALAKASIGLAVIAGVATAGMALAARGGQLTRVPTTASLIVAWSAGVMIAFGASLRALPRDREDGVVALLRARGVSATAYVRGRIAGLVVVLALAVGGATLAACVAATAGAHPPGAVLRASAAAMVYALAFAITLGPVAMAALGARTRAGGYLTLLAVLILPEAIESYTARILPPGWHELTSIPAALEAVRGAVLSPHSSPAAARAAAGLAGVVLASFALALARVPRAEDAAGPAR
jgi:hypothetical protein